MTAKGKNKTLRRAQFGDPILRQTARLLAKPEVLSGKIQHLIEDMQNTLTTLKLGVGLAAPQVGERLAMAVIVIQPTKHRPKVEPFSLVLINPEITETFGRKKQMWEGCISTGPGKAGLFAKVPRHTKIKLKYMDEKAVQHNQIYKDLPAQVIQHELDHLNGILFVDRVKDTKTYMTYQEYVKHVAKKSPKT